MENWKAKPQSLTFCMLLALISGSVANAQYSDKVANVDRGPKPTAASLHVYCEPKNEDVVVLNNSRSGRALLLASLIESGEKRVDQFNLKAQFSNERVEDKITAVESMNQNQRAIEHYKSELAQIGAPKWDRQQSPFEFVFYRMRPVRNKDFNCVRSPTGGPREFCKTLSSNDDHQEIIPRTLKGQFYKDLDSIRRKESELGDLERSLNSFNRTDPDSLKPKLTQMRKDGVEKLKKEIAALSKRVARVRIEGKPQWNPKTESPWNYITTKLKPFEGSDYDCTSHGGGR